MTLRNVAKILTTDARDKDIIKTQFDVTDVSAYFKFFADQVTGADRGMIIKSKNFNDAIAMIWGSGTVGIWQTDYWGDGTINLAYTTSRVVHPNRKYVESFNSTTFRDTASTDAVWTGNSVCTFTGSDTASSLAIYLNNETLSSATLTAQDSGSVSYLMRVNTASAFESVLNGTTHIFATAGDELQWQATSTGSASISSLEVEY